MTDPLISIAYSDKDVRDRLQRLQRKVGDLTPAMKNIGEILVASTDDRFAKEVDPQGNPWKANSAYTIAKKKAEGRINKILQSTGRGRASINYQASRDRVVVGTPVPYMRKHQLGIGVAQRQFLGISESDRAEIVEAIDEFLMEE